MPSLKIGVKKIGVTFYDLFLLIEVLAHRSTETQNITLKNLTLFRPEL